VKKRSYYGSTFRQALKHFSVQIEIILFYSGFLNSLANELDFPLLGLGQTGRLLLAESSPFSFLP
jgi:hypothetical protein